MKGSDDWTIMLSLPALQIRTKADHAVNIFPILALILSHFLQKLFSLY